MEQINFSGKLIKCNRNWKHGVHMWHVARGLVSRLVCYGRLANDANGRDNHYEDVIITWSEYGAISLFICCLSGKHSKRKQSMSIRNDLFHLVKHASIVCNQELKVNAGVITWSLTTDKSHYKLNYWISDGHVIIYEFIKFDLDVVVLIVFQLDVYFHAVW